jgi:RNA polymerase sigma-70 factor (ECF subfamily)
MSLQPPTDRGQWIARVVQQFEGPLVRYAQRITGDLEQARDVAQETFLRLCRERAATLDGHLAQWLFTVCRRRAIDVRKKEIRMQSLSEALADECSSHDAEPNSVLEQQESAAAIYRLIARLPENQQEVVRLKFQNGLSYREISEVTGLTVTNVGYLLHTALCSLRAEANK